MGDGCSAPRRGGSRRLARIGAAVAVGGFLVPLEAGAVPGPTVIATLEQEAPGFWDSVEPIALTFVADFRTIRTEDRQDGAPLLPAAIVVDSSGMRVPALVRTRGNFRLRRSTCVHPPLRVRLDPDAASPVPAPPELRGMGNARLVSPCRGNDSDLVWLEYLAYRIYSRLSPDAFAARPIRGTFVDTSGRDATRTTDAFLLEGDGHLARRLGLELVPDTLSARMDPRLLDPASETLISVFQYLIGNTDWGVEVRHNVVVGRRDFRYLAVPYDFDFSGLVNAPYAAPDPRFGARSVTERLYRGVCRSDEQWRAVLDRLAAERDGILGELERLGGLSGNRRASARRYLQDFFREAESGRALRSFRATCR